MRYRYYISSSLNQGSKARAGTLNRVPAIEIETLVIAAVRKRFSIETAAHPGSRTMRKANANDPAGPTDKSLIATHVLRVDVTPGQLAVTLKSAHQNPKPQDAMCGTIAEQSSSPAGNNGSDHLNERHRNSLGAKLFIPWIKKPSKLPREIIRPSNVALLGSDNRPIRAETRAKLVAAIAKGRHWLNEITVGTVDVEQIANREKCSIRQVNRMITLAFLAPNLVQAAIDGRLPRGIGIASLRECPSEWHEQHRKLGLAS
jgi:hypothetical protein